MKKFKRISAVCAAAVLAFSMGTTCYAGEWKETDSGKMYLDDDGTAVKGVREIDGETYYFNNKGLMKTGWLNDKKGNKFYFGSDGAMKTGWLKTKAGKYYLSKNGAAVKGVKKIGGSYYCFDDEGLMQTGWQESDGNSFYYEASGKRAVNKTLSIDGKKYKFDRNGNIITADRPKAEAAPEKKEEIYPTSISAKADEIPMRLDTRAYITFNLEPKNTTYKEFTYKSSNKDIVEIDKYGEMHAKKEGSCYITVTSKHSSSVSFSVKVVVTN